MPPDDQPYSGLLLDIGGVLTTDFFAAIGAHCERLGLPRDRFRQVVTTDPVGRRLYHQIERGEITQATFEEGLAERLGVERHGLLKGLLADAQPNVAIINAAKRARQTGVRTGVITNSWGTDPYNPYQGFDLHRRFDAVVISGEVGLRKPEPAIYALAAERLGLSPSACVFVDDVEQNLSPARALGMATIHHVENAATLYQLERLLQIPLGDEAEPSPVDENGSTLPGAAARRSTGPDPPSL
jgi:putative hydrolase of the HAD superfamily